jgi:hypothetical protein
MSDELLSPPYWDVFPKSIRVSLTESEQLIPLSVRGNAEAPVFQSSNTDVVNVDENGVLSFSGNIGNAMIIVWDSPAKLSVRHVAVEVRYASWFAEYPDFRGVAIMSVSGVVIDALNTMGIPNVTILLRRSETGPVVAQAVTNSGGYYGVNLREGLYYYEASAQNYITGTGLINVTDSGTSGTSIVLSPVLVGKVARIVLQWGATPSDLDSHLWGPLPNGTRFHVYYSNDYQQDAAELDVDDTSSYGPETVTIMRFLPGPFRYYVHNYTNRSANPSWALAQSGATVKLFLQSGQQYTFNVPNLAGTAWFVFEIDGATGQITTKNTMFYQANPTLVGL